MGALATDQVIPWSASTYAAFAVAITPPSPSIPDVPAFPAGPSSLSASGAHNFLGAQTLGGQKLNYPDLSPFIHRRLPPDTYNATHDELFNRIIHPYNIIEFQRLLTKHNLLKDYPRLIENLTNGFPLGRMPVLTRTIVIRNDSSVDKNRDVVIAYLEEELAKNRMSGPFTFQEMEEICRGHFYCSPMIVVTQDQGPNEAPKKRVCRHLSKGDAAAGMPAVNSFINKEDFPTKFDFPVDVAHSVSTS
jgi:hypothetical protein